LPSEQSINTLLIMGSISPIAAPWQRETTHPSLWHKACNIPFKKDDPFGLPIPS
jgi:hypothetical protein